MLEVRLLNGVHIVLLVEVLHSHRNAEHHHGYGGQCDLDLLVVWGALDSLAVLLQVQAIDPWQPTPKVAHLT